MTEKIKINVAKSVAAILAKDAEAFEFFKTDGITFNKNTLYTRIIVNYHNAFRAKEAELSGYLRKKLSQCKLSKADLDRLCYEVSSHLNKREAGANNEKFDCPLSLKPTKESEHIIEYIDNFLLGGGTLSEYFRNMFTSYASLPQDEREKIVFQPQYRALTEAIAQSKKVFLTLSRGGKSIEVSPYALSESKEELHVYLLSVRNGECFPLRLSRIISVTTLPASATFSQDQKDAFCKMITYGPQFRCGKHEGETKIRLTALGVELFKKMYVHRPMPTKTEGQDYYFQCSYAQIRQYFTRFGKEAHVLYPASTRRYMMDFHRSAVKQYYEKRE